MANLSFLYKPDEHVLSFTSNLGLYLHFQFLKAHVFFISKVPRPSLLTYCLGLVVEAGWFFCSQNSIFTFSLHFQFNIAFVLFSPEEMLSPSPL